MTSLRLRLALGVLAALTAGAPAFGQQPGNPAPAAPQEAPAPYEPAMLRLAEIMGSLAYLRDLCGHGDGDSWRARMGTLVDSEGGSPARKERIAGAYNRGFKAYETIYRACTPNAEAIIHRYLTEAAALVRDIATRYGGG